MSKKFLFARPVKDVANEIPPGQQEQTPANLIECTTCEEKEEVIWISEDVQSHVKRWLSKIAREKNPFQNFCQNLVDESDVHVKSSSYVASDPYSRFCWENRDEFEFSWDGKEDARSGRFTGQGIVRFDNGDEISGFFRGGVREGKCTVTTASMHLVGDFRNNLLQGFGKLIDTTSGDVFDGYFKDSCLHGLVRRTGEDQELIFIGRYRNGIPFGLCWKLLEGGGILFGKVNRKGLFSGEDIMFIYPDLETCFVGWFNNGVMVSAKEGHISAWRLVDGMMTLDWKEPPIKNRHGFGLESRKYNSLCSYPTERDPYESRMVTCSNSSVPGAGEGLFVNIDVEPDTVLAFYNGTRISADSDDSDESWEECAYRIFIDPDSDERVDMPREFLDPQVYCATLGHKVNHSFQPNCNFDVFDHPRFGRIPAIVSAYALTAGTELFAYYRYSLSECPKWYSDLWEQLGSSDPGTES